MKIQVKYVKGLSEKEMLFMNKQRVKEFGHIAIKDWKKDYPLSSKVFFVKHKDKIVSFGLLRPIKINYMSKNYHIFGICSIISVEKEKGYGKILINSVINYLEKKGKTGLGFTVKTKFFKKAGLNIKKKFIKRFRYKNPKTGKIEIDNEGDGIYYPGKDGFIKKVLSSKSIVYIDIPFW